MNKIIDKTGTGKTHKLLMLAQANNGVIICDSPEKMRERAYKYGITGLDFITYEDYWHNAIETEDFIAGRRVYIDRISDFLKAYDADICGYTDCMEDA